nr:transcription initiation factor TFIID subunit 6 [Tanacetum cinerariifolium]
MFQVINKEPLPKALPDTAVIGHWLVVEGVQPAIPENPSVEDEYLELYFSERDNRKESKEANNKKQSNHPCKRRILRVL